MHLEDYLRIMKLDEFDQISVMFDVEDDRVMEIGAKMEAINSQAQAYMNGYNWEAFLNYYLSKYETDLAENLETDPEAGAFYAYYSPLSPESEERAEKLCGIIKSLIENPEELYRIVREEGDQIEWD